MFDDLIKKKEIKINFPVPPRGTAKKSERQGQYEEWMKKRLGLRGVKSPGYLCLMTL